ncbi:unnamed protein product [Mytilus coruscus]|uniref:Uncharacterized protein n=1 Tax=Mytilus coruscus TaxID=42192 RepID=A0A6J8CCY1_MYTCO|nr:unnamed protein product [Mytilus coruscus]
MNIEWEDSDKKKKVLNLKDEEKPFIEKLPHSDTFKTVIKICHNTKKVNDKDDLVNDPNHQLDGKQTSENKVAKQPDQCMRWDIVVKALQSIENKLANCHMMNSKKLESLEQNIYDSIKVLLGLSRCVRRNTLRWDYIWKYIYGDITTMICGYRYWSY